MKIIKKYILSFFLLFFLSLGTAMAHPFYVSICQVDYNLQNRSLEISVKIFADDLLIALEDKKTHNLYLGEDRENPETDSFIFNYLSKNLFIKTDNQNQTFQFVGKEMEDNAVWIYLEIENVDSFQKIKVTNQILTEVYESQSNIIQINHKNKILSLLLKKNNSTGELLF